MGQPRSATGQQPSGSFEALAQDIELDMGFDINAAFQSALSDVASDEAMLLEEKVSRMEFIVEQGSSELYRDFVDFRGMAAQMELICNHDHAVNQAMRSSGILGGFMDNQRVDDGHGHAAGQVHDGASHDRNKSHDDEHSDTSKKKKEKSKERAKQKSSWREWYAALRKSRLIWRSFSTS